MYDLQKPIKIISQKQIAVAEDILKDNTTFQQYFRLCVAMFSTAKAYRKRIQTPLRQRGIWPLYPQLFPPIQGIQGNVIVLQARQEVM